MPARFCCLFLVIGGIAPAQWLAVNQPRINQPRQSHEFSRDILAAHNQIRARLAVPPLTWSSSLAIRAQDWANRLLHDGQFYHRPNPRFGENLFEISGGHASAAEVVGDWASEVRDYSYRANTCRGKCGHYTQIVWRTTRQVGCAVAAARNREVWVCNYDPPGNWIGERPY
ncbi:MAG TPA: CAP domain-containing protein [Bryobacteraceae bacterium]|nr:CAP domain-containing protein [Bryobacteraceae bacterium]